MNRRTFATALLGVCSVSGCLGSTMPGDSSEATTDTTSGETSKTTSKKTVRKTKKPNEETSGHPLTNWERSTDCEGEHDGMYDSVVKVARVAEELPKIYDPIEFSKLSSAEKDILRKVTDVGGYGTCDTSDAFDSFVDRVTDHRERQEADEMHVYLERGGTYYGLYVEVLDQVFAY